MENITFNLTRQFNKLKSELEKAELNVFKKGNFILGEQVENFEKEFARYLKTRFCIGVSSGTDALIIALKALEIKKDDEVIIPANAYPTAFAVALSGAKIRLVDVDSKTFNINPDAVKKAITKKTKVIIPVHLYGQSADLSPILALAKKHKLFIVEDACQAHGATYHGGKVGTLGDIGCFSFYPTKNLGAYGDAGVVVTNNSKIAEKVRLLRMYGEKKRYESIIVGSNSRLDEIQAGFLRVKLKYLNMWNKKRREIANIYTKTLKNLPIILAAERPYGKHVYHQYVILSTQRDKFKKFLEKKGIATLILYPTPIHLQKSFKMLGKPGDFPVAEKLSREILSLPIYPELKDKEIERVCFAVKEFFRQQSIPS